MVHLAHLGLGIHSYRLGLAENETEELGEELRGYDKVKCIFRRQTDQPGSCLYSPKAKDRPTGKAIHLPQIQQATGPPKLSRKHQLSTRRIQVSAHMGMGTEPTHNPCPPPVHRDTPEENIPC